MPAYNEKSSFKLFSSQEDPGWQCGLQARYCICCRHMDALSAHGADDKGRVSEDHKADVPDR